MVMSGLTMRLQLINTVYVVLQLTNPFFSSLQRVLYSFRLWSSDLQAMETPVLSVANKGQVPLYEKTFSIRFPCTGKKSGIFEMAVVLNYTTTYTSLRSKNKQFLLRVRRSCIKRNNQGVSTSPPDTVEQANSTPSRVVIVSVAAAVTITLCIAGCMLIFWWHQRKNKKLHMKFDCDYELAASRKIEDQQQLLEELFADDVDAPEKPIFCPKPSTKPEPKKWKKSRRRRHRTIHIPVDGSGSCSSSVVSLPISPNSLGRILENIPEELEELREIEHEEKRARSAPCSRSDSGIVADYTRVSNTTVSELGSPDLQFDMDVTAQDPGAAEDSRQLYQVLNDHWSERFRNCLLERDQVVIDSSSLGKGSFGRVHRGYVKGLDKNEPTYTTMVAVKIMRESSDFDVISSFVSDGLLMKEFNHPNILHLVGVVLLPSAPPMIVMPFMKYGDLNQFLRNARPTPRKPQSVGTRQLISFGHQISRGMEYLSELQYLHRDLATRNCMVSENLVIKISDFGLTKHGSRDGDLRLCVKAHQPCGWMAIESLTESLFTVKSDVWSFGVVLWELMTLGKQPYSGINRQDLEVHLLNNRLAKPPNCPGEIYDIMGSCWKLQPKDRPTFFELSSRLLTFIENYKKTKHEHSGRTMSCSK